MRRVGALLDPGPDEDRLARCRRGRRGRSSPAGRRRWPPGGGTPAPAPIPVGRRPPRRGRPARQRCARRSCSGDPRRSPSRLTTSGSPSSAARARGPGPGRPPARCAGVGIPCSAHSAGSRDLSASRRGSPGGTRGNRKRSRRTSPCSASSIAPASSVVSRTAGVASASAMRPRPATTTSGSEGSAHQGQRRARWRDRAAGAQSCSCAACTATPRRPSERMTPRAPWCMTFGSVLSSTTGTSVSSRTPRPARDAGAGRTVVTPPGARYPERGIGRSRPAPGGTGAPSRGPRPGGRPARSPGPSPGRPDRRSSAAPGRRRGGSPA